jgi:hypothetical protein
MEDRIFEMELPVDKNSKEFDLKLLQQIKELKNIPVDKFDLLMKKLMKRKSSCQLWWDNKEVSEWDYESKSYKKCNYRCCPSSHKARNYFCLILDREGSEITVVDGFLTSI